MVRPGPVSGLSAVSERLPPAPSGTRPLTGDTVVAKAVSLQKELGEKSRVTKHG